MQVEILDIITEIQEARGSNTKLEILRRHQSNPVLSRCFELALNSNISFYIRKLPAPLGDHRGIVSLSDALESLSILSERTKTGNAASDWLSELFSRVSESDYEVLKLVLGRDLRCGVGEGSVNKIWPKLIKSFPVMLCSSYSEKSLAGIQYPAYAQLKSDGARVTAIIDLDTNGAEFKSRSGNTLDVSDNLVDLVVSAIKPVLGNGRWVLDGEMISVVDGEVEDRSTGNGLFNKAVKGTLSPEEESTLRFEVWDIIPHSSFSAGKSTEPYSARLSVLNSIAENDFVTVIPTEVVNNVSEATKVYKKYIERGLEGIILKNMHGRWVDGRSKDQVKFKQVLVADLEVVDVLPGKAGKKYESVAGSVTMKTREGMVQVNVSGMSEDLRQWFMDNKDSVIGTIWEVSYNGIVKSEGSDTYSLFLPRFTTGEQRIDKSEANWFHELQESETKVSL